MKSIFPNPTPDQLYKTLIRRTSLRRHHTDIQLRIKNFIKDFNYDIPRIICDNYKDKLGINKTINQIPNYEDVYLNILSEYEDDIDYQDNLIVEKKYNSMWFLDGIYYKILRLTINRNMTYYLDVNEEKKIKNIFNSSVYFEELKHLCYYDLGIKVCYGRRPADIWYDKRSVLDILSALIQKNIIKYHDHKSSYLFNKCNDLINNRFNSQYFIQYVTEIAYKISDPRSGNELLEAFIQTNHNLNKEEKTLIQYRFDKILTHAFDVVVSGGYGGPKLPKHDSRRGFSKENVTLTNILNLIVDSYKNSLLKKDETILWSPIKGKIKTSDIISDLEKNRMKSEYFLNIIHLSIDLIIRHNL